MKNRTKSVIRIMTALGFLAMLFIGKTIYAGVVGGYVNTDKKEFMVVVNAQSQKMLVGAAIESIKINGGIEKRRGSLYVVNPNGSWQVVARSFQDRFGTTILAPAGRFDKVVYLDYRYRIMGGIGFTDAEIARLANFYRVADAVVASRLVSQTRLQGFLDGVELAGNSVRSAYRMDDDERSAIFTGTVGMTAGIDAKKVVNGILMVAKEYDEAPFVGIKDVLFDEREEFVASKLIRGIGVISEGDNGGPGKGYVAEGDNGGPGKGYVAEGDNGGPGKGYVAEGDNGGPGKGLVEEGDNGGPGKGLIMQGWDGSAFNMDLPQARGLTANCMGTLVLAF